MAEDTVNQRLKNLIDALGLSVNAFGDAIGVPGTTTRNYLVRGTNPKSDFLAKVARRFEQVSPIWLFTGEGEMFLDSPSGSAIQTGNLNQAGTSNKQTIKGNKGNVIGTNNGTAIGSVELEGCKRDLHDAQRQIEHLQAQLKMQETVIAAKDETITLLRASFNRPN